MRRVSGIFDLLFFQPERITSSEKIQISLLFFAFPAVDYVAALYQFPDNLVEHFLINIKLSTIYKISGDNKNRCSQIQLLACEALAEEGKDSKGCLLWRVKT